MSKKFWCAVIVMSLMATASGCGSSQQGWTLQDTTRNDALPDDFKNRTVYKDSAAVRADIPDFIGHVIEIGPDGASKKLTFERFVVNNARPAIVPVDATGGQIYYSKIDKTFKDSSSGSYLIASISASVSNEEMLELVIKDVATASLESAQIDKNALVKLAKNPGKAGTKRCFVQGVRIASITYKKYTKANIDAKIAIGEAFQSNGTMYNSSAAYTSDFKLSVDCIDLDVLRPEVSGIGLEDLGRLDTVFNRLDRLRPQRALLLSGAPPQSAM